MLDPATENCSKQTSLPEGAATLVVDESPATEAGISTGTSLETSFFLVRLGGGGGGGGKVLIYFPCRPFSLQSFLLFYPK